MESVQQGGQPSSPPATEYVYTHIQVHMYTLDNLLTISLISLIGQVHPRKWKNCIFLKFKKMPKMTAAKDAL